MSGNDSVAEGILFVIADGIDAHNWARANGIPGLRWRYAGRRGEALRGQYMPSVVLLPGWTGSRTPEEEAATRANLEAARAYYVDYGTPSKLDPWRPELVAKQSIWVEEHREDG